MKESIKTPKIPDCANRSIVPLIVPTEPIVPFVPANVNTGVYIAKSRPMAQCGTISGTITTRRNGTIESGQSGTIEVGSVVVARSVSHWF
jgi:hypothetical protein